MTGPSTAWDPGQYGRFEAERSQPFYDLAALVQPAPGMTVADLGCGPGTLTAWLHRELGASETVGIDASATMLGRASAHEGDGVHFEEANIETWAPARQFDLVFSNAALQWVDGHEALWPRLASLVAPGGQIAIQMPVNDDHPSHAEARSLAGEEPFHSQLEGYERRFPTLAPERYASLLHDLGFRPQHVRVQVYGHLLPETAAVVEWVKGSLLTPYRERLPAEAYALFLERYTSRLIERVGAHAPYLYTFKRVLMWGRRA